MCRKPRTRCGCWLLVEQNLVRTQQLYGRAVLCCVLVRRYILGASFVSFFQAEYLLFSILAVSGPYTPRLTPRIAYHTAVVVVPAAWGHRYLITFAVARDVKSCSQKIDRIQDHMSPYIPGLTVGSRPALRLASFFYRNDASLLAGNRLRS